MAGITTTRSTRAIPASVQAPRLILLISVLALLLIGFVMVYSASFVEAIGEALKAANASGEEIDYTSIDTTSSVLRQVGFAIGGLLLAVLLWKFVPFRVWRGPFAWVFWGVCCLLLLATAFFGIEENGARRWLSLGVINMQPSEFFKIAVVVMLARILVDLHDGSLSAKALVVQIIVFIILPILLMYQTQSDLGTTIIIGVGLLSVLWLGRVPTKIIIGILCVCFCFIFFSIFFTDYRIARFTLLLNPWNDGSDGYGTGYQLIHSYYAFADGGLFGVGLGNSHEKYLYLPEAETDYIFAVIGEELGLVGAFAVIALFLLLLFGGLRIAQAAVDNFGSMVAGGLAVMLVFQAFLNMACATGLFPTTGKPLPFISLGGSSVVVSLCMVGMILSVSNEASGPTIYDKRRADLHVVRAITDEQNTKPSVSAGSARRAFSFITAPVSARKTAADQSGAKRTDRQPGMP